ncbi:MAG TPA: DUF2442 domain-containing protein [Thermoanaerobaculia bacterium]|nr:DUF2442 domain-containing protein [Thermoanaerobaculia bacterium]
MDHPIHRVVSFVRKADFVLQVQFADGITQIIDFRPVLRGELYGPLADSTVFSRVRVDEEAGTLVWPNGADFDPAILHDWPERESELTAMASTWAQPVVR